MGQDDSTKQRESPHTVPPDTTDFDDHWDDEVLGQDRQTLLVVGDDDEASERITAVPDLPTEQYVALVMSQADQIEAQSPFAEAPKLDRPGAAAAPNTPADTPAADTTPPAARGSPQRPAAPVSGTRTTDAQTGLAPLELDDLEFHLADDLDTTTTSSLPPLSSDLPPPASVPASDATASAGAARLEMQDRYAIGDFTGALAVAERLLQQNTGDAEAGRYARSCRSVLTEMYTARLGSLHQLITVAVPPTQVRWLSLDHRAGFVLSLVDNASTVEELLDISGMPPLDTLRILTELLEQGVIVVSPS